MNTIKGKPSFSLSQKITIFYPLFVMQKDQEEEIQYVLKSANAY